MKKYGMRGMQSSKSSHTGQAGTQRNTIDSPRQKDKPYGKGSGKGGYLAMADANFNMTGKCY